MGESCSRHGQCKNESQMNGSCPSCHSRRSSGPPQRPHQRSDSRVRWRLYRFEFGGAIEHLGGHGVVDAKVPVLDVLVCEGVSRVCRHLVPTMR